LFDARVAGAIRNLGLETRRERVEALLSRAPGMRAALCWAARLDIDRRTDAAELVARIDDDLPSTSRSG
jgi:hypothetical protein